MFSPGARSFTVREVVRTVLPASIEAIKGAGLNDARFSLDRGDLLSAIESGEVRATRVGDSPDDWIVPAHALQRWVVRVSLEWDGGQTEFNPLLATERARNRS
jgi:hypothetical protein